MSETITRTVGPKAAKRALRKAFNHKRPVFLWGSPGIGKSDIIKQLGEELKAHVIDIRLSLWEPTDIKGVPYFDSEAKGMVWAPPVELPSQQLADQHKKIILFLDEMNSAPPAVQAASYQLILNRRVGTYKLPDNVIVVAAGNRETDRGVTFRMPAPLSNRFVHLEMTVEFDDWFDWAISNEIHNDVVGFLTFSKNSLYDFDPKSNSRAFATPRSWQFVSDFLSDDVHDEETITDLTCGTVGEGLGIKFMAHRKMASKLPNPSDILSGKVTKLETKDISALYSLTISLCYELKELSNKQVGNLNDQLDIFFTFVMNNFEPELAILSCRLLLAKYQIQIQPYEVKSFSAYYKKYGKYVISNT